VKEIEAYRKKDRTREQYEKGTRIIWKIENTKVERREE
jgi:hypothetical protein